MAINEQWNIKSRAHVCAATGRHFSEGDVFFTALFEDKHGLLERRDYSVEAWEADDGPSSQAFSHWRSTYTPPTREERKEAVHKESAEELLRRLVAEDDAHTENARFILAVMLERQKILRQTDANKIGATKLLIYEHRKTGDVLIIRDPEIPLNDVDKVQTEVTLLLDQEHTVTNETESADPVDIEPAAQADTPDEPDTPEDPADPV